MLVPLGGYREFICKHGFDDDTIAKSLGFDIPDENDWDEDETKFNPWSARNELYALHRTCEKRHQRTKAPGHIAENIALLGKRVGLSDIDKRILEFTICLHHEVVLEKAAKWVGEMSTLSLFRVLSEVLGLPEADIRESLKTDGVLAKSGLVRIERDHGSHELNSKLELLSDRFADDIISSHDDPVSALKNTFFVSSPPHLSIDDYPHLPELKALKIYLEKSVSGSRHGVNIFLYGRPGTGKTQLAKVLAKTAGCELYEVAGEDEERGRIASSNRIKALRLAQHFFANNKTMLLFDEADDVFEGEYHPFSMFFSGKSVAQSHKASTNRLLEENQVVTLWLSNSIRSLDPAFVRRFDMIMELPVPPRRQRRKIIAQSCASLIDDETLARFANEENLVPAVVTRAASVVDAIKNELRPDEVETVLELIVNNTLKAQNHKAIPANDPNALPGTYDPAFINTEVDINKIAAGLKKSKVGRLCLYGPPGTGKTACARWLAEQLQIPLEVKRGSDLISMWVGGTERNIAAAFRQATADGALLLIDEMDGFLQDRRQAVRSWEVTAVNEMLTQMEAFAGIFIASTNLLDHLDQAALRRFDLKLKFDFLRSQQTAELFKRYCAELKISLPNQRTMAAVTRLHNATPGDFAAITRRHRFNPIRSAAQLAKALADECALKENAPRPVEFV